MTSLFLNRTAQLAIDLSVLAAAYVLAYVVRFEGNIPPEMLRTLALTLPYVVALHYGLMLIFGATKISWRYIGLSDVRRIAGTLFVGTVMLVSWRWFVLILAANITWAIRALIPLGVTASFAVFAFLGVIGVRVLRRMLLERSESGGRKRPERDPIPTMLIGAGRAGVLVAKEIVGRPDLGIRAVGFLDDNLEKIGTLIQGIPVLGMTKELTRFCTRYEAKQALITIADASGADIRRIAALCEEARIPVKIIPGLYEIMGGQVNISRMRNVAIADLLRREPVELDEVAMRDTYRNRVVMVTGAGGSIGSELCRQVARFSPKQLLLVERSENSLFHIDREIRAQFNSLNALSCIADIGDGKRMETLFGTYRPDIVLHAAAHKHVPMMEINPGEAIKNNVLGTKLIADIADRHGVGEFVMISTDKAVNPTSVMGSAKRAAEIYIQALSQRSKTRFVAVRFGNVLASAGSVVPLFQEQIARGGPVTVTDPEMKRYFMTIPEASQLVLQAGSLGKGGEIFVLDMGEPVKIVDLARDLITLSGLRPHEDIEIVFTGVRPGEKLFEELAIEGEQVDRTSHKKIFVNRIRPSRWEDVVLQIGELERAAHLTDPEAIWAALAQMVPEFAPRAEARKRSINAA